MKWRRGPAWIAVAALAVFAFAAPPVATHLTGFALDEQHTAFPFARPGFREVPSSGQAFDGDTATFDLLAGRSDKGLEFAADESGMVRSPALARAASAFRNLSLVMAEAGQAAGPDGEGFVSETAIRTALLEWPALSDAVLDRCGKGGCTISRLLESTRFLCLSSRSLVRMDVDGDGRVTREEFAGAPLTRPHLLGTDGLGRDLFVRLLHGLRMSLIVGLIAAAVAACLGVAWGAVAGWLGGAADMAMMRFVDVVYGLPYIFLVILLISITGPSTAVLLLCIACVRWLSMARMVRGLVASLKTAAFIEAAMVQGAGAGRIIVTHVLPNARRPILAWTTLLVPAAIKEEAFLSFLGLGVQPPAASLGTLIADGAPRIAESPWLVAAPATVLFLLVLLVTLACEDQT